MTAPLQIGPYRIVDVLGRGGMGVVYRATHASGADAAVKTVRVAPESTLESIRREIQTLRELRHPGVVAIRDHGVADGMPWYAMDLLHGGTLRDVFRAWFSDQVTLEGTTRGMGRVDASTRDLLGPSRRPAADAPPAVDGPAADAPPYSFASIAAVFHAICEPLAYVHGQGVVHRDLSPVNIFLVDGAHVVLFDFGLAAQFRIDSARDVLEIGGRLRGTAHYMAPEQVRGEVVDARADIYALGCILYEALTGRPPFLGEEPLDVLRQHLEASPFPPSVIAPEVPPGFDELVARLLAKAPRDRIGYAQDVAAALERLGAPRSRAPELAPAPRAYTYRPSLAGRTGMVHAFDRLLERLADGVGGSGVLIGESGAGKTRLAAEVATRANEHDLRVITGECEPISAARDVLRGAPLHPLRPLLRAVADRCRDGGAAETERLLGRSGGVLAVYEPALASLVPPPGDHVDPVAMRFRVLAAMRDVIVELARGERLVLVIDDLQWADELTLALLRSMRGDFLGSAGVFVLATVRADEMAPEIESTLAALRAERFEVPRLDRGAIGAIVRDMLALEEDAPSLTEFVAARSEGNPLFAAEYVRTAVDEGLLHRDALGRWRVGAHGDEGYDKLPTPGSVQELVHRRLGSLAPASREVALAAATLGRTCAPEVVGAVADLTGEVARAAITELIQRHVLEELADGHLRFVHDKLREQAYGEMAEDTRRRYHRRAASVLEAHYRADADLALHFAQLAQHHERAGELDAAASYLERAADHALGSAAFGEARALLGHLLELPIAAAPSRRARWNRQLGEACFALGDLASCATHIQRSLDQLGHALPASKLGWAAAVAGGIGGQLWTRTLGRGRARAGDAPTVEAALAAARMTSCYFFKGDSLGVIGASLAAVNLAERAGAGVAIAEIYAQLGYVAGVARLGRVASAYFAQARDTARATRDPVGLGRALYSEAAFHVGVGAWPAARAAAEQGLAIATELRNPQEAEVAHTILGHVMFATGDYEGSRRSAITLHESARARANLQHETWGVYTQARAALYVGDLGAAIRDFERAMAMLEGQADHASYVLCGGMMACALARAGDLSRARVAADATTERIGARRPPVFTISEGFIGAADAYLELWRRGDRSAAAAARVALANLARLARAFPIAGPAARTLAGVSLLRAGQPRRALPLLRRGLALAEQLQMPYDQAVAHAALAEAGAGAGGAVDHAASARRLFERLGCRWHLAAVTGGPVRRAAP